MRCVTLSTAGGISEMSGQPVSAGRSCRDSFISFCRANQPHQSRQQHQTMPLPGSGASARSDRSSRRRRQRHQGRDEGIRRRLGWCGASLDFGIFVKIRCVEHCCSFLCVQVSLLSYYSLHLGSSLIVRRMSVLFVTTLRFVRSFVRLFVRPAMS
jgi:hypothetical protein